MSCFEENGNPYRDILEAMHLATLQEQAEAGDSKAALAANNEVVHLMATNPQGYKEILATAYEMRKDGLISLPKLEIQSSDLRIRPLRQR